MDGYNYAELVIFNFYYCVYAIVSDFSTANYKTITMTSKGNYENKLEKKIYSKWSLNWPKRGKITVTVAAADQGN